MSENFDKKKILFSVGGTGGHLFPAIATAEKLKERGHKVVFILDERAKRYFDKYNHQFDSVTLNAKSSVKKKFLSSIFNVIKMSFATFQGKKIILTQNPDMIVGFGGYQTLPLFFAGILLKRKLAIHEQNAVIGRANALVAKYCKFIAMAFHNNENKLINKLKSKVPLKVIGNPVRENIMEQKDSSYPIINPEDKINILIVGGSQGASIFGEVIPEAISLLPDDIKKKITICQQVQEHQINHVSKIYSDLGIEAEINNFFNDMAEKYKKAHLIISRSGASTVFEIITSGKPAIFVPYPYATLKHQYYNAKQVCDKKAGWLVQQQYLTPSKLSDLLNEILSNPEELMKTALNLRKIERKDSAALLADLIEAYSSK